jgi:TPR repeat protein
MKTDDRQDGMRAYKKGDYKTALEKWKPLAVQGDAQAQFNLGLMCLYGQGVNKDYTEAVKWYVKAAEQGFVKAQLKLGIMYLDGNEVNQDTIQALKWFDIASLNGDEKGCEMGGALEKNMTRIQIAEARKLVGDGYFTNGANWLGEKPPTGFRFSKKEGEWSYEELEKPPTGFGFTKKQGEIQSKTSENSSQSKGALYTHSERGIKYCSNCANEIYPYNSYITEKYDGEKWQDIVFPEGEKIFCSSRCSKESRDEGGRDVNTSFGNYK